MVTYFRLSIRNMIMHKRIGKTNTLINIISGIISLNINSAISIVIIFNWLIIFLHAKIAIKLHVTKQLRLFFRLSCVKLYTLVLT